MTGASEQKGNVRALALRLLTDWEEKDGFANLLLSDRVLAQAGEGSAFLAALFYGAVERKITLDYWICALAAREEDEISPTARRILRLGLYQLLFMNIPPHAAVAETVALSDKRSERGFINAVLREADRRRDDMPMPPKDRAVRYLSVKESFPREKVRKFIELYGQEETERLLAAFNEVKPLTLTVRSEEVRERLLAAFAEKGIRAEKTVYAPRGIRVLSSVSPTALQGFAEGGFFVQDEASQIAAEALGAHRGDRVIDVCACPGGKTFGAAFRAEGEGEFFAFDLHESKLPLIKEGAERLGLSVTVKAVDAAVGDAALFGSADRVICDVPCSGLGVLGKKADLRYRTPSEGLTALQYEILCTAAKYVKKDGVLLYSTCTLAKEENEENLLRFLTEHADFAAEDFAVGSEKCVQSEGGMLTLLPHKHGCDGFFIAKLRRKA